MVIELHCSVYYIVSNSLIQIILLSHIFLIEETERFFYKLFYEWCRNRYLNRYDIIFEALVNDEIRIHFSNQTFNINSAGM